MFVSVAPKWLVEPNNSSVVVGQMGQIPCAANGYPQPQTYWMKKDGRFLFRIVYPLIYVNKTYFYR